MVKILQDSVLSSLIPIQHAFFTRQGGVSKGRYSYLNCAVKSRDHPENIQENQRIALNAIHRPFGSLVLFDAQHSNQAIIVGESEDILKTPPIGDALVTRNPKLTLGAESADCATLLWADESAGVIAISHAGWRGALSGIMESTLQKMQLLGAAPHQISVAIGPAIAQAHYEVDQNFYQQFLNHDHRNNEFFLPSHKEDHWQFDLPGFIKQRLSRLGLKSISNVGLDTYANDDLFFSCRRAKHLKEPDFGGHLACIYLK